MDVVLLSLNSFAVVLLGCRATDVINAALACTVCNVSQVKGQRSDLDQQDLWRI